MFIREFTYIFQSCTERTEGKFLLDTDLKTNFVETLKIMRILQQILII